MFVLPLFEKFLSVCLRRFSENSVRFIWINPVKCAVMFAPPPTPSLREEHVISTAMFCLSTHIYCSVWPTTFCENPTIFIDCLSPLWENPVSATADLLLRLIIKHYVSFQPLQISSLHHSAPISRKAIEQF